MTALENPATSPSTEPSRASRRPLTGTRAAVRSAWDSPVTSYYLIGSVTCILLALGLVFVLSSSTIYSLRATSGVSPFRDFLSQAQFAIVGGVMCFLASRLPTRIVHRLAWPGFLVGLVFQLLPLVAADGRMRGTGNYAWVKLGPITFQPSEFAKVALVVWLGVVLAARREDLGRIRSWILPAGGAALMIALQVFITHDLGTMFVLAALVAGALWVAGLPLRYFAGLALATLPVIGFFLTQGETRMARIMAMLQGSEADPTGIGLQAHQSLAALGTGGLSGVGLGGSRTKWLYLPEAHNDFIFAIIGEELGLLGTLLVLGLFVLLLVGLWRVVQRHPNPFVQITTGAVAAWIGFQALVNIGVVIGLVPVLGVPLPLISSGGSSLIATLLALGFVLAFARDEPGAKEALRARRGAVRRTFGVLASGMRRGTGRAGRARGGLPR